MRSQLDLRIAIIAILVFAICTIIMTYFGNVLHNDVLILVLMTLWGLSALIGPVYIFRFVRSHLRR